jgi:hypothetical protein
MENPRTDSARDHDDSAMIEGIEPGPAEGSRTGGNLATDVATQAEEARVGDPEHDTRVTKEDEIAHGTEVRPDRPRAPQG